MSIYIVTQNEGASMDENKNKIGKLVQNNFVSLGTKSMMNNIINDVKKAAVAKDSPPKNLGSDLKKTVK